MDIRMEKKTVKFPESVLLRFFTAFKFNTCTCSFLITFIKIIKVDCKKGKKI